MEARSAHLEVLVMSMVTQMKSNAPILGKTREWKGSPSFNFDVDLKYLCGSGFLGPLVSNVMISNILKDHVR